jgi:eukaryotic-like serine/threonine-protein kinase
MPPISTPEEHENTRRRLGLLTPEERDEVMRRHGFPTHDEQKQIWRRYGIVTPELPAAAYQAVGTDLAATEGIPAVQTLVLPEAFRWLPTGGKQLGKGGQGEVLEVFDRDNVNGGKYALKVLRPNKPKAALQRFKTEIEAIMALSHPNIIRIVDFSDKADFPYYVMELVEGAVSLKAHIEKDTCPIKGDAGRAIEFFIELAGVIKACESKGIVHRDLSPGNILIAPSGAIKVIDFGVCQMEGHLPVTLAGESVGTHDYMAPECESWAEGDFTSKTDLYSAGKLLWSAVTGQTAFSHEYLVFNTVSMPKMFPDKPETFHLHIIFEGTTRHSPQDRFASVDVAIEEALGVRYRILNRYPPIELIVDGICPMCGVRSTQPSVDPYTNQQQVQQWYQCQYCGYRFTRFAREDLARKNLDRRKTLR